MKFRMEIKEYTLKIIWSGLFSVGNRQKKRLKQKSIKKTATVSVVFLLK